MTRFFVTPDRIVNGTVTFDPADSHHIHTVLKMRAGDRCIVLDGAGRACECTLAEVAKSRVVATVSRETWPASEPDVRIDVAQALPKTLDKLEWVLQHGTEAGASGFIVFSSERSRAEAERFEKKIPRWQEIVKTAAEQSERGKLPVVEGIIGFTEIVKRASEYDLALLAYERETGRTLRDALTGTPRRILVIVGPEGGFTDGEISEARRAGLLTVSLGPRILRTETTALVIVSQILYAFGG